MKHLFLIGVFCVIAFTSKAQFPGLIEFSLELFSKDIIEETDGFYRTMPEYDDDGDMKTWIVIPSHYTTEYLIAAVNRAVLRRYSDINIIRHWHEFDGGHAVMFNVENEPSYIFFILYNENRQLLAIMVSKI
jgi:hypothetical protein